MDIAKFSISHRIVTWLFILLFTAGGLYAYLHLSRYEDPEFTIKEALVLTKYPGATPLQVEEEVTEKVTEAIQQMAQIKRVEAISRPGFSRVNVVIKDKFNKKQLPQVWDELRRKVDDVQSSLPPGAKKSLVVDDYGDVFGMLYAITGDGFSAAELRDYAKDIKKRLLLVDGVAKVNLTGIEQEAIFIEIAHDKMASLGLSLDRIYQLISSQNTVLQSGQVRVGDDFIQVIPSGAIAALEDIGNILIPSERSNSQIYLSDIASIKREFIEVPQELSFYNGQPAIMMGISIVSGGNVVVIGSKVEKAIQAIDTQIPVGIELHKVYDQPDVVKKSVNGFLMNLIAAILIVLIVLILFMGAKTAFVISSALFLIIMGTLYFMSIFGISLERISLGALVIALGMLVDNAIVVADGILTRCERGMKVIDAAAEIVKQTQWPLLGATFVGIIAFAPIGLSQDNTGEYAASLFYVILISLLLSWLIAVTAVPLLSYYLFGKADKAPKIEETEPAYLKGYRIFLNLCLTHRWATIACCILLLLLSFFGFRYVPSGFFPNSTTPIFYIDYWLAEGTDIRRLRDDMLAISKHIQKEDEVEAVTMVLGKGMQRFLLVYTPESENPAYGQFVIHMKKYESISAYAQRLKQWISENYPDSAAYIQRIRLGPGGGAKIEARFSGPDPKILRQLAKKAEAIMRDNPEAIDIRNDWRQKVKIISPDYSEMRGRTTGISREDLATALQTAFPGKTIGVYREKDELLPIISRAPDAERLSVQSMLELPVWSELLQKNVTVDQVIKKINIKWQNNIIASRNRLRTLTVMTDPKTVEASILFNELQPKIEAIPLPAGYQLAWGGEYENASDAQKGLAKNIPMGVILMIGIVIILFNSLRQPLVIWLCVPFSFVGVTVGLLLTYNPFDFMAILGFLSLTGMLIKNGIVLIDQIDMEIAEGKEKKQAIIDSSVSRLRPVSLAALTTVLGMAPLLLDAFFVAMAVVIMFGLSFATVLTLVVVPVFYDAIIPEKLKK
jgi:multidrug efflux pump subunit AcrB